jgi:large subunit ribosomal protein L18
VLRLKRAKLKKSRSLRRNRRHLRVRAKVSGSSERPRLVVYRSLRNIEGQLVDDLARRTLLGLSTLAPELRDLVPEEGSLRIGRAFAAGRLLAERAREKGIESVVFDRGGYRYHGRVQAFADGAREGGLKF